MRLKIQEQNELNFVSRIIQWPLAIGNCPDSSGQKTEPRGVYRYTLSDAVCSAADHGALQGMSVL